MSRSSYVKPEAFGTLPDGREVKILTLANRNGFKALGTGYGATLASVKTPDGVENPPPSPTAVTRLAAGLPTPPVLEATVARFGNRTRGGKLTLDGGESKLASNNDPGEIHQHRMIHGFSAC